MGCGLSQPVPCPHPRLVGLWISDDVTNKSNLIANHEYEKRATACGCSKQKQTPFYKSCTGSVLEIFASGHVNYIECEGMWARNVYAGPITNWDGPDGVWTGCCVGCCGCEKGCVHFDVAVMPHPDVADKLIVNGRSMSKEGCVVEAEIPVVVAQPIDEPEIKPFNPMYSPT